MSEYDAIARLYDPWSTSVVEDISFYVDEALQAAAHPVVELGVGTGRIAIPTARPGALFAWIADLENAGVVVDTIDVTNNGDQTVAANILLMKRGA